MFPRLLLFLTVIIWGFSFVATKICLDYVSPVELLGLRLLLGLPVILFLITLRKASLRFKQQSLRRIAIGGVVLAAHFIIQIVGINYTSATNTGWIIAVTPLVIVAVSYVFLKEKVGASDLIGIAVATAGILLLISKGAIGDFSWLKSTGDWLVLASAHTWAAYTAITRDVSRSENPLSVTFMVLLPSAAISIGYMLFSSDWSSFAQLPTKPLIALLFLGIVALALGLWSWQEGVAKIGASKAGVFLYIEPLATTSLAVPLLHESFGLLSAIGGMMVLGGVYISQRKR
jgi:RarD protein